MNPTKVTQVGKTKVNAIESAMNENSGIELADNVLRSCFFASASAGKCPQIRCMTDSVPQKVSLATLTGISRMHRLQAGNYYHIPEARLSGAVCEYNFGYPKATATKEVGYFIEDKDI